MAVGLRRETASTVRAHARMTRFNMDSTSTAAAPRQGNEPDVRLVVRIRCSVHMSTETHLVGGTTRRFHTRNAAQAVSLFPVEDAAVRRMLTKLPQLAQYYGHRTAEVQLWDGCVPPGLVADILREVAAGGVHRSYVCNVWMHVDFVSVCSEAKEKNIT